MIGNVTLLNGYNRFVKPTYNLYIPLQFSFNRFNGLSLPLIAINNTDIIVRIDFNDLYNCIQTDFDQLSTTDLRNVIALDSVELLVDYVYLDRNERRKFAQFSHEYLENKLKLKLLKI